MPTTTRLLELGFLLAIAAGLTGCGDLSSNVIGGNPAQLDALYARGDSLRNVTDSLARPLVDSGENVGIVVGVLDAADERHVFSYGKAALDSAGGPNGKTIFAVGSLTKSFVTALYQKMIDEGTVKSDETVGEILPDETSFTPEAKAITLDQLANHTSGLPRQPIEFAMFKSLIHYELTGGNIYRHLDRASLYRYLGEFHPSASEINAYRYSNIGMGLLGELLAVKAGKPLPDLLAEKIIDPLGLIDTAYAVPPDKQVRLATGYVGRSPLFLARNTPIANWDMDEALEGAAGLYSTVDDLLTFTQYRMGIRAPVTSVPLNSGLFDFDAPHFHAVSLGWDVDQFDDGTRIVFQHGMIAGFSAYMGIEPDKHLAVVVLYNNFDWDDHIGHTLLLTLSRNEFETAARREVAP